MQRRARIALVAAGTAGVALAVGALAFGPIVRNRAHKEAERRGLVVQIASVRPGFGRVVPRDVRLFAPEVPTVEARLDELEVDLTLGLGVEAFAIRGGLVRITGEPARVAEQIDAWRGRRAGSKGGQTSAVAYSVEGLHVTWLEGVDRPQRLWGLRYERGADGHEEASAERATLGWGPVAVDTRAPRISVRRTQGRRLLERLSAEGVEARFDLELSELSTSWPGSGDKGQGSAATDSGPEAGRKKQAIVPPDHGRERGQRLRAALARIGDLVRTALPPEGELDLAGLRLSVRHAGEELGVGPGRLRVKRAANHAELSFVPGSAAQPERSKTPLTVALTLPLAEGPVKMKLEGGPVSLAALGVRDGELGLERVDEARIEARGNVELSADGSRMKLAGSGTLSEVSVLHRALSSQPVRGLRIGWRGRGDLALDGSEVRIAEGSLEVGRVHVDIKGDIENREDRLRVNLRGGVPLASCQSMLESLPEGLTPLLTDLRMAGTFALAASVNFDSRRPSDAEVNWDMKNDCRITAAPANVLPQRFREPFVIEVEGTDGARMPFETGPGTPNWVPLGAISPHMATAIVVCEDAGFFRHRGFDAGAIENSIRDNLATRRFLRGASTVPMQLAKNLYLRREKTVSRKLQEAVLTLLLVQELEKEQLLELYLNVIEYARGVYGIGPAAKHYFNTTPDNLSLGQALYIASILSNPKQRHFTAEGKLSEGWSNYLRKLMHIAFKIRRIDERELETALEEQIAFGVPNARPGLMPGQEIVRDEAIYGDFSLPARGGAVPASDVDP